ncbi:MAG TPA: helix-turn-helix domain-containing protein, partial [Solirubrobacteraceae bacterium]|nr:helix-turn-helix domain-containing protein [Solirubrobacteraceae bacterium]
MFVVAVALSGEEAWAVVTTVRILGPIEVWDRERRVELGGPRQVSLLALLVLEANRAVTADALIDALWRDGDVSTRKRLQMAVRRLRQALEPVSGGGRLWLDTVAGGYLLRLERTELDSELFAAG